MASWLAVACAANPAAAYRVIVKPKDASLLRDTGRLAQQVSARAGVEATLAAPIADDMAALALRCDEQDGSCERALARLRESGLFESVEPDRRARRLSPRNPSNGERR